MTEQKEPRSLGEALPAEMTRFRDVVMPPHPMTIPTDGRIDLDALAELAQRLRDANGWLAALDYPGVGTAMATCEDGANALDNFIDLSRRAAIPSEQGEAVLPRAEDGRIAPPLEFGYTNWRGEFSQRCAVPIAVRFGSTEWHPEPQWLLTAWDAEKAATRDFAMRDLVLASYPAPAAGVKVKALEWEDPSPKNNNVWVARTVLGTYCIGCEGGWWYAVLDEGFRHWEWEPENDARSYSGPFAAQAAAQQDYEARILSALDQGEPK